MLIARAVEIINATDYPGDAAAVYNSAVIECGKRLLSRKRVIIITYLWKEGLSRYRSCIDLLGRNTPI